MRYLFLPFLLSNAILYSLALPLWEGFDEPFHYANVQQAGVCRCLPDAARATLSQEVAASLALAPGSHIVKRNLPQVRTYAEFLALPVAERSAIRDRLRSIPVSDRWIGSPTPNYEAHQAPLAYWMMAAVDVAAGEQPLWRRVLLLRVLVAISGALLLAYAASALAKELGASQTGRDVLLFCLFTTQMTWATIAHVANDWLALPLAVGAMASLLAYARLRTARAAIGTALVHGLGLLTKAYFLAFLPVLLGVCLYKSGVRRTALVAAIVVLTGGWWYERNLRLYGSLSAMQESRQGVTARAMRTAAGKINWTRTLYTSAHMGLWTGNNSFFSFSASTIGLLLLVWIALLGLWASSSPRGPDWIVATYVLLFLGALAYVTVLTHVSTGGAARVPSPWYTQVIVTPLYALGILGACRRPRAGRVLLRLLVALSAYVLLATYVVKLIPHYAGFAGAMPVSRLMAVYTAQFLTLAGNLAMTVLVPLGVIAALLAVTAGLTLALVWRLFRELGASSRANTSQA